MNYKGDYKMKIIELEISKTKSNIECHESVLRMCNNDNIKALYDIELWKLSKLEKALKYATKRQTEKDELAIENDTSKINEDLDKRILWNNKTFKDALEDCEGMKDAFDDGGAFGIPFTELIPYLKMRIKEVSK